MSAETKYREGLEALERGNKAVTKTLFKWKPDFETAAMEYNKAATAFRAAKSYEQAKVAYIKAAEAHAENKSYFLAGQAVDNAAGMAKNLGRIEEGADLLERASEYYTQNMNADQTFDALKRAGEMLAEANPERAISYYLRACDVIVTEGREQFGGETFKATYAILLRNKNAAKCHPFGRYDQVLPVMTAHISALRRLEQRSAMQRLMLSLIVVMLANDDAVGASQRYQEFLQEPGFMQSDEGKAAHQLLDAVESGDEALLRPLVNKGPFIYLDNEIAKTAKQLKVTGAPSGARGGGGGGDGGGGDSDLL